MTINLPWKTWLVAGVIIAAAVFMWNRTHKQLTDAQRDAEAAQLALKQQIVEVQESKGALQSSVKDLMGQNELLKEAYESALRAAPDAKPVSEARLDTGPLRVHTPPRPAPQPVQSAGGAGETQAAATAQPALPPAGPSSVYALRDIDQMSIEVEQVELQTKAGNTVVIGVASAYVLEPIKALLAEGKFQSPLSASHSLETALPARWGFGGAIACPWGGRCSYGPAAAFPPLSLLGVRLEATAAVMGGSGTLWGNVVGIVRW